MTPKSRRVCNTTLQNYQRDYIHPHEISPTNTDTLIVRYIRAYSKNNGDKITHYIFKIIIVGSIDLANIYIPATPDNKRITQEIISAMEEDFPFHLANIKFKNLRLWRYECATENKKIIGIKGEADAVTMED